MKALTVGELFTMVADLAAHLVVVAVALPVLDEAVEARKLEIQVLHPLLHDELQGGLENGISLVTEVMLCEAGLVGKLDFRPLMMASRPVPKRCSTACL